MNSTVPGKYVWDGEEVPQPTEAVIDALWSRYGYLWPNPMHDGTRDSVAAEFHRRGFYTEEHIPAFLAWVDWDGWYRHTPGEQFLSEVPSPNWKYINVYVTEQMYGGPEEGGWYYEAGDPLASLPVHASTPQDVVDSMKAQLENRCRAICPGTVKSFTEEHYACSYPERRPHYE